jgi:hypothetical protein
MFRRLDLQVVPPVLPSNPPPPSSSLSHLQGCLQQGHCHRQLALALVLDRLCRRRLFVRGRLLALHDLLLRLGLDGLLSNHLQREGGDENV